MKVHDCPTCSGRDPHRTADVVMVTGPDKRGAVRIREAWRSFWRHRGEEISAAWQWLPEGVRFVACAVPLCVLLFGGIVVCASLLNANANAECEQRCALLGVEGVRDYGCWCIINDKPQRWEQIGADHD